MNALGIMQSSYWAIAGWTMLHFLWIGSLVALAAALGRIALRRAAPQIRYAYALLCFAVLGASPVAIAVWVAPEVPRDVGSAHVADASGEVVEQTAWAPEESHPAPSDALSSVNPWGASQGDASLPASLEPDKVLQRGAGLAVVAVELLPWIWIAGTPITLAMLLAGFVGAERLRRQSSTLEHGELQVLCAALSASLAIARQVTVGVCDRIGSPIVLGVVKPMILLPPAALAGWSPDQLEMVLLHELAHVRRWDNLVNLLQRLVESLLFFHPAVWVTSAWVRSEREHCCDAAVVAHTGRPEAYAETLASLAGANVTPWATATAMAERNLTTRIRRLLNLEDPAMRVSFNKLGFVIGTCAAAALIVMSYAQTPNGVSGGDVAVASSVEEVAVDEEPVFDDVAVAEEAAFVADQPNDREVSDTKKRLQALLREREDYRSQLRKMEAKLVRLEQLLAERNGRAAQKISHADDSSAQAQELGRLLKLLEDQSSALQKRLSMLESTYVRPGKTRAYQQARTQLEWLAAEKARIEDSLERVASASQGTSDKQRRFRETLEFDRARIAIDQQRIKKDEQRIRALEAQRHEARLEHEARMATPRKTAHKEIELLKTTLELVRRSQKDQPEQSEAVRKSEEWLRQQIEELESQVEASEVRRRQLVHPDAKPRDPTNKLNDDMQNPFRRLGTFQARQPRDRAHALFDDALELLHPDAKPRDRATQPPERRPQVTSPHGPRGEDRGRLERLEREMRELKQMIRKLQDAVTSRATSAVLPASPVLTVQPVPAAGPARPAIISPPSRAPRLPSASARPLPAQLPAGPTLIPKIVVPPRAGPAPAQRPAGPTEPKPSARPEPTEAPKLPSEPAEPPDVPKEIEP